MPQQNTPTAPKGATHSMEHADRAHADISAKIKRLTWGMGEDQARRMAGPMLLASAYAEIDRLAAEAAVQQTAMVRALGQDIDGLGPPGLGRFYLVLEVPTGLLGDVLTEAVTSGRIGLVRAGS